MREFIRGGVFTAEGENKKYCSESSLFLVVGGGGI
jgi:hypothetical protein